MGFYMPSTSELSNVTLDGNTFTNTGGEDTQSAIFLNSTGTAGTKIINTHQSLYPRGVVCNAAAPTVTMLDNDLTASTTRSLSGTCGAGSYIANNPGVNPFGLAGSPPGFPLTTVGVANPYFENAIVTITNGSGTSPSSLAAAWAVILPRLPFRQAPSCRSTLASVKP